MIQTKDQRLTARARFARPYAGATVALAARLPDGSEVTVYRQGERAYLLAFAGTAGRPSAHSSYRTEERAIEAARQWLDGRRDHAERVAATRRQRATFQTTLEPGRILRESWGYDQTNIDYYQVVAVSPSRRTVTIRKIGARAVDDGWLTGVCWPLADHFIGPPMVKVVGEGESVKIRDWGSWAYPWEPKTDHWSAYH